MAGSPPNTVLQRLKKKLSAFTPYFANEPANSEPVEQGAETSVPDMRRNGLDNVVLHIGQPKTGTTLLQNWALANSAALASEGIFVLPSELEAHRLAVNCITESSRLQMPDIPPIHALPFDSACGTLLEGASRVGVHTTLVSSEYFSIVDPSDVATMFAGMGVSVTRVICFVRRQDDLLASGYNQDVKALGYSAPFCPPTTWLRAYDWSSLRDDWQRAFPKAQIILRNFDHHRNHGTLVEAFVQDIGATSTYELPAIPTVNERLCAELLDIVRRANAAGLPEIAHLAIKAQASGLMGTPFALSERERRSILRLYRASNSRLAKEDPRGEFGDFAHDRDKHPGLNMTGTFPAEFALKLLAWQINQTPDLSCRSDDSKCPRHGTVRLAPLHH